MKLYHNNIEILNILVDDTSVRYRSIMQLSELQGKSEVGRQYVLAQLGDDLNY